MKKDSTALQMFALLMALAASAPDDGGILYSDNTVLSWEDYYTMVREHPEERNK